MKEEKKYLTYERLRNKFNSNFDLVNYAIKLARLHIAEENPKHVNEIIDELEMLPDLT